MKSFLGGNLVILVVAISLSLANCQLNYMTQFKAISKLSSWTHWENKEGYRANSRDKEQITQIFQSCSKKVFCKSRNHRRVMLHLFFNFGGIWKVERFKPESTKPATRKSKNNLKCSISHLASNEVSLKYEKALWWFNCSSFGVWL